ncbi:hypothetical protein B9J87_15000, partial [Vibrio sp. V19_P1S1T109]|uniref:inverse autotransporter beta domain-containing protein n=1 Tax=Vibrio sp. V19_P1S1T109 TaxID=1938672 RepID=UPI000B9F9372
MLYRYLSIFLSFIIPIQAFSNSYFEHEVNDGLYIQKDTRSVSSVPIEFIDSINSIGIDFIHLFDGVEPPDTSLVNIITKHFGTSNLFVWQDEKVNRYRLMLRVPNDVDKVQYLDEARTYVSEAFIWSWVGQTDGQVASTIKSDFQPVAVLNSLPLSDLKGVTPTNNQASSLSDTVGQQALGLLMALDGKDDSDFGEEVEGYLKRQVQGSFEQYANQYLNESLESSLESINGVVRSSLSVSTSGIKGELEALVPLYSNDKDFVFVQPGFVLNDKGRYNGRDFVHAGIGYRTKVDDFMYGVNTFYDYDLERGHKRASIGGELWHEAYSFYTNYYFPLSAWVASPDTFSTLDDMSLQERPAYGLDVGVSGYLPSYPWLSANLSYEQQFGNHVENERGENPTSSPYQIGVSLDYSPIPMISFGISHKYDSATGSDYSANLGFQYIFGESLSKQLDPAYIKGTRGHDYQQKTSFVQRNHDIVLEYRKTPFSIELVGEGEVTISSGVTRNTAEFVQLSNSSDIKQLSYTGSAVPFLTGTGVLASSGALRANSSVPTQFVKEFNHDIKYASSATDNFYELTYVATLKDGSSYQTRPLRIRFEPPRGGSFDQQNTYSKYEVTVNDAIADGKATNELRVTLKDANDNAVAGETISFTLNGSGQAASPLTATTDSSGRAIFRLSNKVAETVTVTAMHSSGSRDAYVTFLADPTTANINGVNSSFVVVKDGEKADGKATNELRVTLKDANDNLVAGEAITFDVISGDVTLIETKVTTDTDGKATAKVTSKKAGKATIRATYDGESKEVEVIFVADSAKAVLTAFTVGTNGQPANGSDQNSVTATVKDPNGNP